MASSTITKANKPFEVDTGISGVTAWKSGNMVTLGIYCIVSDTTSGWKELGVLPKELRPTITNIYFSGYDNNVSSYSTNVVQDCSVTKYGSLNVYLFPDKLGLRLSATVTYPTLN